MPEHHAKISPSGLADNMLCLARLQMLARNPAASSDSDASRRGTAGHWLVECWLDGADPQVGDTAPNGWPIEEELFSAALKCWDWVREQRFDWIRSEQRVPVGQGLRITNPDMCWGTSDIIALKGRALYVLDFKFGYIEVASKNNSQMRAYLTGALEIVPRERVDRDQMHVAVIQPAHWPPEPAHVPHDELIMWQRRAREAIPRMLDDNPPFTPGESQCRFCVETCRARIEADFDAIDDIPDDVIDTDEVAHWLERAPAIKATLAALHKYAERAILTGTTVPGFKLVEGSTRRRWSDEKEAMTILSGHVHDLDEIAPRKLQSPAQIEKMNLSTDGLTEKPKGKPALVRESDRRPPLAGDFEILD